MNWWDNRWSLYRVAERNSAYEPYDDVRGLEARLHKDGVVIQTEKQGDETIAEFCKRIGMNDE